MIPSEVVTEESANFSQFELDRYSRQIRTDGFGLACQQRLKSSTALVSRVGGVGGSAAVNLARAGIGRLILAHGGVVHAEYLNRWLMAMTDDVGRPCTEVMREKLHLINPAVEVLTLPENVNDRNVSGLVAQADVVLDGAPLFEERYLLNREAVRQRKPLTMGAMYGAESYVTSIVPHETPCLACIYPVKPDYWTDIKVFPAFGPGPVIVGSMLAMEAIKLLTGFGQPLKNKLWFFDAEHNIAQHLHIRRRADCPVCGNPKPGRE
jgi:molybdopterin/thiamine biosynthesis adenylyltransferase